MRSITGPVPTPRGSGPTWSSEGCTTHSSRRGGLPGRGPSPGPRAPLVAGSTHTASSGPATETGNRISGRSATTAALLIHELNLKQKNSLQETTVWTTDSYCGQTGKANPRVREANGRKACWTTAGFTGIKCGRGQGSLEGLGEGTPGPPMCGVWEAG